jgi:peptidoglycan/xylan/chitin deacetylase (PgdA/CDA1 family)
LPPPEELAWASLAPSYTRNNASVNKDTFYRGISYAFCAIRGVVRRLRRLARGRQDTDLVVLLYHQVPDSSKQAFAEQIDRVLERGRVVDLGRRPLRLQPGLNVGITFDDALSSSFRNGVEELLRRGLPVLVFVPTGSLGRPPGWFRHVRPPAEGDLVLSPDELRHYAHRGVRFGSHTVSHPHLSRVRDEQLLRELVDSRRELESVLGGTVDMLAFPYGDYDGKVLLHAQRAGYRTVFGSIPELSTMALDGFLLTRVNVSVSDPMPGFDLKIRGGYGWQGAAVRLKRQLHGLCHPRRVAQARGAQI